MPQLAHFNNLAPALFTTWHFQVLFKGRPIHTVSQNLLLMPQRARTRLEASSLLHNPPKGLLVLLWLPTRPCCNVSGPAGFPLAQPLQRQQQPHHMPGKDHRQRLQRKGSKSGPQGGVLPPAMPTSWGKIPRHCNARGCYHSPTTEALLMGNFSITGQEALF